MSRDRSEPDGSVLVRHSRQRNPLADIEIAREQPAVALVPVGRAGALPVHQLRQPGDQLLVPLFVVRPVREDDVPLAVEGDPVLRVRQVLRREPEVQRSISSYVTGQAGEMPPWWRISPKSSLRRRKSAAP